MDQSYITDFVRGYLGCALWAENDQSDEAGGNPLDENYTVDDIAPESLAAVQKDCAEFINRHARTLAKYGKYTGRDAAHCGHDFWLNRNGHGTGFWDRGAGFLGRRLSDACGFQTDFPPIDIYVGDNGLLYISGLKS